MENQQLLLYLGLTNDANPLYVQHDYAKKTEFSTPLVPPVLLMGLITTTISKHLSGPGSQLLGLDFNIEGAVYHYETISFHFKIVRIDLSQEIISIEINGMNEADVEIINALATVKPPHIKI